jgi:hypothetical protein
MARVVVFTDKGARIYEGANPKDFKGSNFLIDPRIPRGVPPHLWKMHKDGYIVGTVPKPKDYTRYIEAGLFMAGLVVSFLVTHYLLR